MNISVSIEVISHVMMTILLASLFIKKFSQGQQTAACLSLQGRSPKNSPSGSFSEDPDEANHLHNAKRPEVWMK